MPIRTTFAVSLLLAAAAAAVALAPAVRAEVPGPRQVIGHGEDGASQTWTLPAGKPYLYVPYVGDGANGVVTSVAVGAEVGAALFNRPFFAARDTGCQAELGTDARPDLKWLGATARFVPAPPEQPEMPGAGAAPAYASMILFERRLGPPPGALVLDRRRTIGIRCENATHKTLYKRLFIPIPEPPAAERCVDLISTQRTAGGRQLSLSFGASDRLALLTPPDSSDRYRDHHHEISATLFREPACRGASLAMHSGDSATGVIRLGDFDFLDKARSVLVAYKSGPIAHFVAQPVVAPAPAVAPAVPPAVAALPKAEPAPVVAEPAKAMPAQPAVQEPIAQAPAAQPVQPEPPATPTPEPAQTVAAAEPAPPPAPKVPEVPAAKAGETDEEPDSTGWSWGKLFSFGSKDDTAEAEAEDLRTEDVQTATGPPPAAEPAPVVPTPPAAQAPARVAPEPAARPKPRLTEIEPSRSPEPKEEALAALPPQSPSPNQPASPRDVQQAMPKLVPIMPPPTGAATAPGAADRKFSFPVHDIYRLNYCLHWQKDCGEAAAAAWCKIKGYQRAAGWKIDENIGGLFPTIVLGDKRVCSKFVCDGFQEITCAN